MTEMINPLSILLSGQKTRSDMQAQRELDAYRSASLDLDRAKMAQADQQFNTGLGFKREESAMNRSDMLTRLRAEMQLKREAMQRDAANEKPVLVRGPDGKLVWSRPADAIGKEAGSLTAKAAQLPATAIKLQNDLMEDLSIAANSHADLGAFINKIDNKELNLGPIQNAKNTALNALGLSSDESRNYSEFRASMEKLRNDSLRLNKGVQTEGDAQRAWNELFANINDPDVVKQRLRVIADTNRRAAQIKGMQINTLRQNFGAGAMDLNPILQPQTPIQTRSSGSADPELDALVGKYRSRRQ